MVTHFSPLTWTHGRHQVFFQEQVSAHGPSLPPGHRCVAALSFCPPPMVSFESAAAPHLGSQGSGHPPASSSARASAGIEAGGKHGRGRGFPFIPRKDASFAGAGRGPPTGQHEPDRVGAAAPRLPCGCCPGCVRRAAVLICYACCYIFCSNLPAILPLRDADC